MGTAVLTGALGVLAVGSFLVAAGLPAMGYNVACAWVRDGVLDDALPWLHRAVDAGLANLAELDRDPNLAGLRGTPGFEQRRSRLTKER